MPISISHGAPYTSATTISQLGQHLAHVLKASEWREIDDLFGKRYDDITHMPPDEAERVGDLLHKAATHRLMPADQRSLAIEIGDAAHRAARAGQTWKWS
ncbi:DUF7739 domain-containing protein [Streptomyces sp. NPDC001118]